MILRQWSNFFLRAQASTPEVRGSKRSIGSSSSSSRLKGNSSARNRTGTVPAKGGALAKETNFAEFLPTVPAAGGATGGKAVAVSKGEGEGEGESFDGFGDGGKGDAAAEEAYAPVGEPRYTDGGAVTNGNATANAEDSAYNYHDVVTPGDDDAYDMPDGFTSKGVVCKYLGALCLETGGGSGCVCVHAATPCAVGAPVHAPTKPRLEMTIMRFFSVDMLLCLGVGAHRRRGL